MDNFHHYQRAASPPRRQRACYNCSKAKARCNFQDENIGKHCDRCHRMGVDCEPQRTQSLRRPRQLKTTQRQHSTPEISPVLGQTPSVTSTFIIPDNHVLPSPLYQTPLETSAPESLEHFIARLDFNVLSEQSRQPLYPSFGLAPEPPSPQVLSGQASASPGYGLSWSQANHALAEYQLRYIHHFPFVPLEPNIGARQLFTKKPFLFRVIMLIAARTSLDKKQVMKRNVMAYLGHHLLVNEERYLDLLQGLLVLIAWGDFDFYLDRQITQLINLAVGYSHNLGLSRVRTPCAERDKFLDKYLLAANDAKEAMWARNPQAREAWNKCLSTEEQRAYLGCYYVLSVNSSHFSRRHDYRSSYIDMSASFLGYLETLDTDTCLMNIVRLQVVIDKIMATFPLPGEDVDSKTKPFACVTHNQIQPLRSQLDQIAQSADSTQPSFRFFWIHYSSALVKLYEPAIYLPGGPPGLDAIAFRVQCFLYCLQAAKQFLTTLARLSPEDMLFLPFATWAQLVAVIVTASKLLLLRVHGWDTSIARQDLDLAAVLGKLAERMTLASSIAQRRSGSGSDSVQSADSEPSPRCRFAKMTEKMLFIKAWFEARVRGEPSIALTDAERAVWGGDEYYNAYEHTDNQFWLGLLGNEGWHSNFTV